MLPEHNRFGWVSNLEDFSRSEPRVVRTRLQAFISDASDSQIRAWDASIPWLQRECREFTAMDSAAREYTTILEYELPRDTRRPDVIFLERGGVVVVEIKGQPNPSQAAIDQVFGYARDLAAYHAACNGVSVTPVLVTRNAPSQFTVRDGVFLCAPESLDSLLDKLDSKSATAVSLQDFLATDAYAPLPSIVQAARELFHKRQLPFIKRARANTEPALNYVTDLAHEAARNRSRHLVLLTGVPGSGKTLVGLQLVHAGWLDDLAVSRGGGKPSSPAVYLSGNGPLVEVLQHALRDAGGRGQTFVQAIKNYVAYHRRQSSPPNEHLIVFDEAQRAHDAGRVAEVHGQPVDKSEPQLLLQFCNRIPEWCVLVALIGDGQAIHVGEEGGPALWADAIRWLPERSNWTVHGAVSLSPYFANAGANTRWTRSLNLDTEIRFHLTPKVHDFVEGLLEDQPPVTLSNLARELYEGGHRFLITRYLDRAKTYLKDRYADAQLARFGLLASSKDKWLPGFDVDNTFQATKRLRVGPWYNADPVDPASCCQLSTVATEFSSQGLELDCALLAWGSDLLRINGAWSIEHSRGTRGKVSDPRGLRINVYRVLLTRGRDGTVIFVPQDSRFDSTHEHLIATGIHTLD